MNRALLVLFAVASLAGCSDSTGPVPTGPLALRAIQTAQILQITNNSDDPYYYLNYAGDAANYDFALCMEPDKCRSIPAHSSITVRYKDIPKVGGDVGVVTVWYWHLVAVPGNGYQCDDVQSTHARL